MLSDYESEKGGFSALAVATLRGALVLSLVMQMRRDATTLLLGVLGGILHTDPRVACLW